MEKEPHFAIPELVADDHHRLTKLLSRALDLSYEDADVIMTEVFNDGKVGARFTEEVLDHIVQKLSQEKGVTVKREDVTRAAGMFKGYEEATKEQVS